MRTGVVGSGELRRRVSGRSRRAIRVGIDRGLAVQLTDLPGSGHLLAGRRLHPESWVTSAGCGHGRRHLSTVWPHPTRVVSSDPLREKARFCLSAGMLPRRRCVLIRAQVASDPASGPRRAAASHPGACAKHLADVVDQDRSVTKRAGQRLPVAARQRFAVAASSGSAPAVLPIRVR
jgi:hypothetical protein